MEENKGILLSIDEENCFDADKIMLGNWEGII